MSSAWHLPKEDSPSVLSDRVYSIRRLNKMESQRLGSQLNNLNAEIAQSKSLISQEQKLLRKELAQIKEIKDNPPVGGERKKLLQEMSLKESQICRHRLSGETQVAQSRFRSLSTGYPPVQGSQLPSLIGRQRRKSTTCPPLRLGAVGDLSEPFRRKELESGILHDMNNNTSQEGRGNAKRNQRVRSLSTGTRPRIAAWIKNTKDGVADSVIDDIEVSSYTKVQNWQNWCQDHAKFEFRRSPNSAAWEEKRRDLYNNYNVKELSKVKINGTVGSIPPDFRQKQGVSSTAPSSRFASTRRERRSYSTNSAPIISEGRVVGLCGKTATLPQPVNTASQRQRCYSTSCNPKEVDEERIGTSNDNAITKREHQSIAVPSDRRRSLSTNCPPVILERRRSVEIHSNNWGPDLTRESKDKQGPKNSSRELVINVSSKHVESNVDFLQSQNCHDYICEPTSSVVGSGNGTEHGDGLSLPRL